MSFQIIYKYSKVDPLVDWYEFSPEVQGVIDAYKANGNILTWEVVEVDSFNREYRITFADAPASVAFGGESTIVALTSSRDIYNNANGITATKEYGQ